MAAAISAAIDIQGAFDRMAFKECFDMQQFMSDSDFNRVMFKQCVDSNFHPLKPFTEYTEFKTYKHVQAESEKYC